MIKITLKSGNIVTWEDKDYDGYLYDSKTLSIFKDDETAAIYNIDSIISCIFK